MNTALAIADITKGGYLVERLTPTTQNYHLCWDRNTDRMVFLDPTSEVVYYDQYTAGDDLWKVAHDDALSNGFSYYLAEDFTNRAALARLTTGVDVGEHTDITAFNYDRHSATEGQEVFIRTNGGTLTIDAPEDTVTHYGLANVVDV